MHRTNDLPRTSDGSKLQSASSPLSQASVIDFKGMSKSSKGIMQEQSKIKFLRKKCR